MSTQLRSVLEALLFASAKPLPARELRDVLHRTAEAEDAPQIARAWSNVATDEIESELATLAAEYEAAARSYRLVCVAGAWQFVSRPEFAPWIRVLVGARPRPPRLSQAALETLAVIAYRQPITRAAIEEVRGVNVDGVIQTLLQRGLIREVGRSNTLGRPVTYGTTDLFLEYFGLRSLEDLPASDELRLWKGETSTQSKNVGTDGVSAPGEAPVSSSLTTVPAAPPAVSIANVQIAIATPAAERSTPGHSAESHPDATHPAAPAS
ncbi:MAG: SMC-Scp complex subunit ScpB [Verrucomicrobiota bacterium]|nr:SMC-Scp complex subunit ScpB [Limisphaera sp.]MDW8381757.1 SMC-Scp complex subunit ScpB [Verrucomicrobiota bacterium]